MAEARRSNEWDQTALLCCLIANAHRDQKTHPRPFELHQFHPFLAKPKRRGMSASRIFEKLESFDGIAPSVVRNNG